MQDSTHSRILLLFNFNQSLKHGKIHGFWLLKMNTNSQDQQIQFHNVISCSCSLYLIFTRSDPLRNRRKKCGKVRENKGKKNQIEIQQKSKSATRCISKSPETIKSIVPRSFSFHRRTYWINSNDNKIKLKAKRNLLTGQREANQAMSLPESESGAPESHEIVTERFTE